EEMMTVPYLDGAQMGDYIGEIEPNVMLTYDLIPKGEAELRETSGVVSADGHTCGHATGLDIEQGQLTNLVLERGHLWWKRSVNVPVESIEAIDNDLVTLKLAKAEVGAMASGKARR